jgi:hypothetical protein
MIVERKLLGWENLRKRVRDFSPPRTDPHKVAEQSSYFEEADGSRCASWHHGMTRPAEGRASNLPVCLFCLRLSIFKHPCCFSRRYIGPTATKVIPSFTIIPYLLLSMTLTKVDVNPRKFVSVVDTPITIRF